MRIGFDVSQTGEEKAGCGFLADQLIRSLTALDKTNEYLLYPTFYHYRNLSFREVTNPESKNCKVHFDGLSFLDMVNGWETAMNDRTGWLGSPDLVHSNNFSCVKDHKAKMVFTLYDITPMVYPEFTTEENRLVCFEGIFNASIYADHCIAISEHTKRSFLDYFPYYPEDRITVIRLGTRPTIKLVKSLRRKNRILNKFNLTNEFWLGVGTIEPRKNYKQLIEAYSELNDDRLLVIAGGRGWLESDLAEKVKHMEMHDRVRFLGYVSDEELSALYSACFAFIYPSFYEGFGLPVLEAMSCGAAVITSNSSSLPEVGGDAVLYSDPKLKESLVKKMKLLVDNQSLLQELRMKSRKRAMRFSWNDAARKTLKVYEETLKNKPWLEK
jgi:glycosyltransferase involved in cell wall biosynthesis